MSSYLETVICVAFSNQISRVGLLMTHVIVQMEVCHDYKAHKELIIMKNTHVY